LAADSTRELTYSFYNNIINTVIEKEGYHGMSIKVGIIGMGFGKEFIAIYQKLSGCEVKAISQRNDKL